MQILIGSLQGNLVKTYWFTNDINFGDLLAPELLKHYGLRPVLVSKNQADIISVGSHLDNLSEDYSGYIVGSGLIRDTIRVFPKAKIRAVRGNLTRERIGASPSTVLGDPGLLSNQLLKINQEKRYEIGFIPHYVDKNDPRIINIYQRYQEEVCLIDVQKQPLDVISDIAKCNFILSSSLHGVIVADSLGIPNTWIVLSDKVVGGGFKFYDYASSFGMKYDPKIMTGDESLSGLLKMTHTVSPAIQGIQKELSDVFNGLRSELRNNN